MFVTNLISIRVFVIIYRCFIRNYVMIFQNVILNLWSIDWWVVGCWMMGVRCLMLGVDDVNFGLLGV